LGAYPRSEGRVLAHHISPGIIRPWLSRKAPCGSPAMGQLLWRVEGFIKRVEASYFEFREPGVCLCARSVLIFSILFGLRISHFRRWISSLSFPSSAGAHFKPKLDRFGAVIRTLAVSVCGRAFCTSSDLWNYLDFARWLATSFTGSPQLGWASRTPWTSLSRTAPSRLCSLSKCWCSLIRCSLTLNFLLFNSQRSASMPRFQYMLLFSVCQVWTYGLLNGTVNERRFVYESEGEDKFQGKVLQLLVFFWQVV